MIFIKNSACILFWRIYCKGLLLDNQWLYVHTTFCKICDEFRRYQQENLLLNIPVSYEGDPNFNSQPESWLS